MPGINDMIYKKEHLPSRNKLNNVQLNEIFLSIEGEGIFAGTKTLFIRFSGCHLKCQWCDTKYSLPLKSGNSYTIEEAKSLILRYIQPGIYKINFTGGEPLLQPSALASLADFARNELHIKTYLESSCFSWQLFESVLQYIDICKIEFKLTDSKVIGSNLYDNLLDNEIKCLDLSLLQTDKVSFIKIVFTNSTNFNELQNLVARIFDRPNIVNLKGFILQPSYQFDSPMPDKILKAYDLIYSYYKEVRVIPQMHKLIGLN
jgi:7-carboxy-7-deazaguanine synthase